VFISLVQQTQETCQLPFTSYQASLKACCDARCLPLSFHTSLHSPLLFLHTFSTPFLMTYFVFTFKNLCSALFHYLSLVDQPPPLLKTDYTAKWYSAKLICSSLSVCLSLVAYRPQSMYLPDVHVSLPDNLAVHPSIVVYQVNSFTAFILFFN